MITGAMARATVCSLGFTQLRKCRATLVCFSPKRLATDTVLSPSSSAVSMAALRGLSHVLQTGLGMGPE
jgi:hypothetical protein